MSPNVKKIKRDLTNSYTVRQTAQLLSLTPKRVRQMLTEGKLKRVSTNPILLDQREVLDLRNAREALKVEQQPATDNTAQLLDQCQKLMDSIHLSNILKFIILLNFYLNIKTLHLLILIVYL